MPFWIKYMTLFVGVILFVLQSCVSSGISQSIDQRNASYSKYSVVNSTYGLDTFLETFCTPREMDCARACTEKAECERYLYCSRNSFCYLYQDGGDCFMSGDTTGCSCFRQIMRCEDSNCTWSLDCITPVSPYSDEHVIPEFDQSVSRWRIGTNLTYRCSPFYYPTVDWTCNTNGTWEEPVCKESGAYKRNSGRWCFYSIYFLYSDALTTCTELFQCNPTYSDGKYIFKYPETDHDMIVQCFPTLSTTYVRLQPNTTFSYYSTNYSASCHPDQYTCGYRQFTAIKILIFQAKVYALNELNFTTTDCDGPTLHRSGKNCQPGCEIPEPGMFQIDLRGTGLKNNLFAVLAGQVVFSDNGQLAIVSCNNCNDRCYASSILKLLPANGTDIDYTNTTIPVCLSRS